MAYNPYYSGYANNYGANYGYNNNNGNYNQPNFNQQPNYNAPQSNFVNNQFQAVAPQTNYLPLTFVNGVEGAKAFIVQPNQTIYLKDSDSNLLFEKRADSQGKYTLNAFEMKDVQINELGKKIEPSSILTDNLAEKKELANYLTLEEFSKYEIKMNNALDRLTRQIDLVVSKTPQVQVKKEG